MLAANFWTVAHERADLVEAYAILSELAAEGVEASLFRLAALLTARRSKLKLSGANHRAHYKTISCFTTSLFVLK